MRILICNCHKSLRLPKIELGPDIKVEEFDDLCKMRPAIAPDEKIVVAACSPNLLEGLFDAANAEFVNILEHVFLVGHGPDKAAEMIRAAVARLEATRPVKTKVFPVKSRHALIIGGGVAGMDAAVQLGRSGISTTLVEKEPFLGGTVAKLDRLYPEGTPHSHTLMPLVNMLQADKHATLLCNTEITKVSGRVGDYKIELLTHPRGVQECTHCGKCIDVCPVEVDDDGRKRKAIYCVPTYPDLYAIDFAACTRCGECIKVCPGRIDLNEKDKVSEIAAGAVVMATGLHWYDVSRVEEYGYGRLPGVMKTLEFERAVAAGTLRPKKVAIIYCAGSRDANHLPYCSKICCLLGLKEAKLIVDRYPDVQVYIAAMDMRSYGTFEYLYNTLREKGVTFIKGKPSEVFQRNGKLAVRTEDLFTNELMEIEVDNVVLSSGFVPDAETFDKFKIDVKLDFPVLYENAGLGNAELPRGIFTAGAATFPAGVAETLIDARKAAQAVASLLAQKELATRLAQTVVDEELCSVCRMCISTCPYGAISVVEEKIKVSEERCMGCGICAVTCPAYATQLESWNHDGLREQIRVLTKPNDIIAILCRWSAYNATERAAHDRLAYPENVKIIRVPCTGAVDPSHVMLALQRGAKGVLIGGCYPHACHYARGNFRARAREQLLKLNLESLGVAGNKIRLEWIGKDEARKFADIVREMND